MLPFLHNSDEFYRVDLQFSYEVKFLIFVSINMYMDGQINIPQSLTPKNW